MALMKILRNLTLLIFVIWGFHQIGSNNRLLADQRGPYCCEDGDVKPEKRGRMGCEDPVLEIHKCTDIVHIVETENCLVQENKEAGECIDRFNSMDLCPERVSGNNEYCCEIDPSQGGCYDDYCPQQHRRYACDWLYGCSISGPAVRLPSQSGTWTASVDGGEPSYSYQWYKWRYCADGCDKEANNGSYASGDRDLPCCKWNYMSSSSSVQTSDQWDFKLKVEVTDDCYAGSRTVTSSEFYVVVDELLAKQNGNTEASFGADTQPTSFELSNYPNPFNAGTTITFTLPEAGLVTLVIYNSSGQRIKTLISEQYMGSRQHEVAWNGKDNNGVDVASGIYLCRLSAPPYGKMIRLLMIK